MTQHADPGAAWTVRMAELRPGDTYANEDGSPVLDDLASHGGRRAGAIPRPFVAPVPLTVARVVPSDHPAWPAPHWIYVEASNGHGATVPADGKTRIMPRANGSRFAINASAHAWQWTYSNITAAEAQRIADQLSAGSGETWTVTEIGGEQAAASEPEACAWTDAGWLYGDSPAGLRQRAAEDLAAEFGTDVSEWLA